MAGRVSLAKVQPPVCEIPPGYPELPPEVYRERLGRLRKRMREAGLDWVVIYADREHAANFSYLAGFGPRFEEALLLVGPEDAGAPRAVLETSASTWRGSPRRSWRSALSHIQP